MFFLGEMDLAKLYLIITWYLSNKAALFIKKIKTEVFVLWTVIIGKITT